MESLVKSLILYLFESAGLRNFLKHCDNDIAASEYCLNFWNDHGIFQAVCDFIGSDFSNANNVKRVLHLDRYTQLPKSNNL